MLIDNEEIFCVDYYYNNKNKLIYAPLRSFLCLVDREVNLSELNNTSSHISSILTILKDKPLINIDELKSNYKNKLPDLSLAITDNCNLRCLYCHASAGELHKNKTMSIDLIDSVLLKYFHCMSSNKSLKGKTIKVTFNGGGEPTYAFNELKHAVCKSRVLAEKYDANCSYVMATNGYYNEEIRNYIISTFNSVSLSMDGPQFIHDKHRPTTLGGGSFNTVLDTAKFFYANNFPFAFRATISDYSLPYYKEIIDFFAEGFPGKAVSFEILNPYGRATSPLNNSLNPPNKNDFSDMLLKAMEYASKKPINLMNAASTEYDVIRFSFCSNIGTPNWTVNVNGDILACQRDNTPDIFKFGQYVEETNSLHFDNVKLDHLSKMSVENYSECTNCFCKYHCAGDCPDRRISDKSDCNSIKKIGSYVLSNKIHL